MLGGLIRSTRYIEIETLDERQLHLLQRRDLRRAGCCACIGRRRQQAIKAGFTAFGEAVRDRAEAAWKAGHGDATSAADDRRPLLREDPEGWRPTCRAPGASPRPTPAPRRSPSSAAAGSLVDVTLKDGRIADYAQEVKACALGQAAAAILGEHVIGASVEEIEMARDALRAMLKAGGPAPEGRFSDLAMLAPVKDYPPRHASTLLAFEATAEACRLALRPAPERTSGRTSRAGAA